MTTFLLINRFETPAKNAKGNAKLHRTAKGFNGISPRIIKKTGKQKNGIKPLTISGRKDITVST
jgi:hypothetical protein